MLIGERMTNVVERVQPIIVAHTQSADRAAVLQDLSVVTIDSSGHETVPWEMPFLRYMPEAHVLDLLTQRAVFKIPLVGDGNVHTAFKTHLIETDNEGRIQSTLPVVETAETLTDNVFEMLQERRLPHILVGSAVAGSRAGTVDGNASLHVVPLRGDLTQEEILRSLKMTPDFHGQEGVKGIRLQDHQASWIDWKRVEEPGLLQPILMGVDPVVWLKMVDAFFPHTLVTKEEMWAVDTKRVIEQLASPGFEELMGGIWKWRNERKFFRGDGEEEGLKLARIDIRRAHDEAVELAEVFVEVSSRNGYQPAGPVAYSPETQQLIRKEAADVLIYLINGVRQAGYNYTPILDRLNSSERPYIQQFPAVMKMIARVASSERMILQLGHMADKAFENVESWQIGRDEALLDYTAMMYESVLRYMMVMGWDPVPVIREAIEQNTYNYPVELCTDEIGPCVSNDQVFALCRLFRKASVDGEQVLARYHQRFRGSSSLAAASNVEVGKDQSVAVRMWVFDELNRIAGQHADNNFGATARELLESLDFSKVLFDVTVLGRRVTAHTGDQLLSVRLQRG